jgi:hypothetical protein
MGNVRYWRLAGRMVMAAALVVGGTATIAHAHAGDGDAQKVHACVHKKNGKVRFVGADASIACKGNEDALHLNIQGEAGPPGPPGTAGREGRSALTALRPGETVSGVWGASVTVQTSNEGYRALATFPVPLAADIPDENQTIYVAGASAPNCPGQGQAAPGFLCVYQAYVENAKTPGQLNIFNPSRLEGLSGASRFGFGVYLEATGPGLSAVIGTFSVSAP